MFILISKVFLRFHFLYFIVIRWFLDASGRLGKNQSYSYTHLDLLSYNEEDNMTFMQLASSGPLYDSFGGLSNKICGLDDESEFEDR